MAPLGEGTWRAVTEKLVFCLLVGLATDEFSVMPW